MKKISVKLKGLKEAITLVKKRNADLYKAVEDAFSDTAMEIELDAKSNAPVDDGQLRASIGVYEESNRFYIGREVGSSVMYAPYVEFGTKTKVSVPAELTSYAKQFQKSGGMFEDLLASIKEWCRKKGMDEKAAFPIALRIARYGVDPQPFLFPAYFENRNKILPRIKENYG